MASVKISARLPVDFYQLLENHMTTNKLFQTEAIIAAITTYFAADNQILWAEMVSKLERGLEILETVKIVNSLPKLNERN
jgi:hypothetical protein